MRLHIDIAGSMFKLGLLSSVALSAFALMGCQHQDAVAPAPPPTLSSAPVPPPPPPPPGPMGQGGWHHAPHSEHVYKLDFALTSKDVKEPAGSTTFSISVADHQTGDINV